MRTLRKTARVIGCSLLLMAVCGGLGYGYALGHFYIKDNAAATATGLNRAPYLLSLATAVFILILFLDIIVSYGIYVLFKNKQKTWAAITSVLRWIYSGVLGIAIYYLVLANGLKNVSHPAEALMQYLNLFLNVWSFGLIIFGGHLLALGILLKKSRITPPVIYMLVLFAGACYCTMNVADLLIPGYTSYKEKVEGVLALPMALGELAFAVWLLFKKHW